MTKAAGDASKGRKDRPDSAKAESNRPKPSDAENNLPRPRRRPPEKQGSWDIKKERQGEAENPGPEEQEVDSDGEEMPTLIQDDDSEVETEDDNEKEEEFDIGKERRLRAQEMRKEEVDGSMEKGSKVTANQQTQDGYCESRTQLEELGGPRYIKPSKVVRSTLSTRREAKEEEKQKLKRPTSSE